MVQLYNDLMHEQWSYMLYVLLVFIWDNTDLGITPYMPVFLAQFLKCNENFYQYSLGVAMAVMLFYFGVTIFFHIVLYRQKYLYVL